MDPAIDATLTFDDTKYEGAEVTVRLNPAADVLMRLEELGDTNQWIRLLMAFGEGVLISWNVDNDGIAIPATGLGFASQPMEFCDLIISTWRGEAAINVDNNLADDEAIEDLDLGDMSVVVPVGANGSES